jgi:hypothetical protein
LNVLEKQALELRLVMMILVARVAALLIGGILGNARVTLALFSAAGILAYGCFCLVVLRACAVPVSQMAGAMARNAAGFIPAGVIIASLKYLGAPSALILTISAGTLAVYYGHVIRSDSTGREILSGMLRKFVPAREELTA